MSSEDTLPEQAPVDEVIRYQEFGVRLREAREALGLSIMDVAEQLNLKVDVLNALESSNIDKLPAPTFTQGYIRAYARLLKLPADDILQGYNSAVPERQHPLVPNYGMPILAASEKSSFNIFIVLVVLLVIAAVSYFVIDVQSPPVSQESDLIEENSLSNAQSEQDQDSLINTDEIITNVPET
ncbi:MAG: helix-turn-helix domain-containing protein, partial [Gammaproteobacteria bacterium]|nr:helix-turn-helix domain-containing protein [Gammaproteobacteria bacterium]